MPLVTRRQPKDRPAGDRAATYDAFISYSQKADKHTAEAIRRVIQTIGTPWWKVRGLNVFLDATSLSAAPGLWQSIETKLDQSRYLILLASPEAAASHWVDREVAHFIAANGIDRLLIALTDGELAWDAAAGDFASADAAPLPPSLRGRFAEEPLWVDLRPFRRDPRSATKTNQAFLHAALDLAATIRGVEKADLYSEEVRHQRRRLRLAYGTAAVVACLAIGVGVAASFAVQNERRAVVASQKATKNFGIAKSTVNRIIFDIAQGLQVTRGVRVDSVRTILSQIQVAMKQLSDAAPDDKDVKHIRVGMFSEFGSVYLKAGDTTMALASFEKGLAEARRLTALDPHQLA